MPTVAATPLGSTFGGNGARSWRHTRSSAARRPLPTDTAVDGATVPAPPPTAGVLQLFFCFIFCCVARPDQRQATGPLEQKQYQKRKRAAG